MQQKTTRFSKAGLASKALAVGLAVCLLASPGAAPFAFAAQLPGSQAAEVSNGGGGVISR